MVDPDDEVPTAEQLEARLNDLAQLYDLGIALRELRFLDLDEERMRLRQLARANDVDTDGGAEPGAPSGERSGQ